MHIRSTPSVNVWKHVLSMQHYVMLDVPGEIMIVLRGDSNRIIQNNFQNTESYSKHLYGSLEKEINYSQAQNLLGNFLKYAAEQYWNTSEIDIDNSKREMILSTNYEGNRDCWINFQKATEYNGLHNHSGILSFVIWIKIPFTVEEENNHPSLIHSKNKHGGSFMFHYPDPINGNVTTHIIPADVNFEGKMIIFDSRLRHCVNPFYTSSDYRISLAGNLIFKE